MEGMNIASGAAGERFRLVRKLGEGGMGVVYEAWDEKFQAPVALKFLSHVEPARLARFKQEFRSLVDLQHPHLVSMYELFSGGEQWFYSMELVHEVGLVNYVREGASSARSDQTMTHMTTNDAGDMHTDVVTATSMPIGRLGGHLLVDRLYSVLQQLARAISALHAAGKLHRDIKPSNVLVSAEGHVSLADFGLVLEISDSEKQAGFAGTVPYCAPEQLTGEYPDGAASDWYAFGTLIFQLLTGRLPFEGEVDGIAQQKTKTRAPLVRDVMASAPRDLAELTDKLLDPVPHRRPNAKHVLLALGGDVAVDRVTTSQTVFVGRANEMETIEDAFLDTTQGGCRGVHIFGLSGMGKTTLVQEALEHIRVQRPDAMILSGRCYERESVPFKALDGLIESFLKLFLREGNVLTDAVPRWVFPALARLFPTLKRIGSDVANDQGVLAVDPDQQRRQAGLALKEVLHALTRRGPLVLYIDDLQWGDLDSLALLSEVFRLPDPPPVLLLTTSRQEDRATSPTLAALAARPFEGMVAEEVLVGTLDREQTRQLVSAVLQSSVDIDLEAILDEAEGNPFFVDALARHAARYGELPVAASSNETGEQKDRLFDALLLEQVQGLSEEARKLLEFIAVAGHPIDQEIVRELADMGQNAPKAFAVLTSERLIRTSTGADGDTVEVYHDRVREAMTRLIGAARLRERHEALALKLESIPSSDPNDLFAHWLGAREATKAGQYALAAAKKAVDALAFDHAAECFADAIAHADLDEEQVRECRLARADALLSARRGTEAADEFLLAADGASKAIRLQTHPKAAEQLLISGHVDRGLSLLRELLAEIGERMPRTLKSTLLSLVWYRIRLALRGTKWRPTPESKIDAQTLLRMDVYWAVGIGMVMADNISGTLFQSRALLLALQSGERRRVLRSLALESILRATQGRSSLKRAKELLAVLRRNLNDEVDPFLLAWTTGSEGFVEYFSGNFVRATELLAASEKKYLEETAGTTAEINNVRMFKLQALRYMGRFTELGPLFREYDRDARRRNDHYAHTTLTRAFNGVYLAADEPERAREVLRSSTWTPLAGGYHMQHWFALRARGEIDLYEGAVSSRWYERIAEVEAWQGSMLQRVQSIRAEGSWLYGRLLLSHGGDLATVKKLTKKLGKERLPHTSVWAAMLASSVSEVEGDGEAQRAHLRRALKFAEVGDMALYAAVVQRALGQLTPGEPGVAMVVEAERSMFELGIQDPEKMARVVLTPVKR